MARVDARDSPCDDLDPGAAEEVGAAAGADVLAGRELVPPGALLPGVLGVDEDDADVAASRLRHGAHGPVSREQARVASADDGDGGALRHVVPPPLAVLTELSCDCLLALSTPGRGMDHPTDLRTALLEHAVALTRDLGPAAVSLREVQRRAGVSPAAAYRHYRDREALLVAVGRRASAALADSIQGSMNVQRRGRTAEKTAVGRLRAGCAAYIDFARREPGLFHAVFLTDEAPQDLASPQPASRGAGGLGPYQLLQQSISDLVDLGVVPAREVAWTHEAVWAGCHGLAVLLLDGPLRHLDEVQKDQALQRLLDILISGLTGGRTRRSERAG